MEKGEEMNHNQLETIESLFVMTWCLIFITAAKNNLTIIFTTIFLILATISFLYHSFKNYKDEEKKK